ncbi:MAG: hypothetical protein DRP80_01410 [Candidatus Omnitrophota bacterium]|nr:MAG: hypothetical protein DRP80_01410 [Candidatus Omnitrophota bacterium]
MRRIIIEDLRSILKEVVERNSYEALLFSGGLDTSILAYLNASCVGITVSLESFSEDLHYSEILAKFLNMEHYHRKVSIDEAMEAIPHLIRILKSFDPAIPNDLVVYFGLKFAKELGIEKVATGDGADELFCGYSYMKDLDDLETHIKRISKNMSFSSNIIGKFYKIKIVQPFCDIVDFALKIPVKLKIKESGGKIWGKWILRKAFEGLLPQEVIWQDKRPLEYGSGMSKLREIIRAKISDEEFEEKKRFYSLKFLNKEHLYFYEIYQKEVGEIPEPSGGEKTCPNCGAGIKLDSFHCRICGYVLKEDK